MQDHNDQPLATYTERLLEVRRDFTLYADRVVVRARWFPRRTFEHVVKLAALTGKFDEITIRYRLYRYAGWILAVAALAYAACFYYAQEAVLRTVGYVALACAVGGGAVPPGPHLPAPPHAALPVSARSPAPSLSTSAAPATPTSSPTSSTRSPARPAAPTSSPRLRRSRGGGFSPRPS